MRCCFLGVLLLLLGCVNEPSGLGIIYSDFDQKYGVVLVDTITVDVSTVLLDSLPTSSKGLLQVGGYQDEKLGALTAEGFIQVGNGSEWQPATVAYFDSLVLVVKYSGYYYGDTTTEVTVDVTRIQQDFKTYTLPQFWISEGQYSALYAPGSLYNLSTVQYEDIPLGSKKIRPRPSSTDSLVIRLDDSLGKEWLELAQNKSESLTDRSKFLEYFKGIGLSAGSSVPNCVIGLNTEKLTIRLYYKQYAGEKLVQQFQEFPFASDLYNYTRITTDRAGTVLQTLSKENNELSSRETDGEVFIQSGAGIATKVKFPYIRKMIDLKNLLIVNQAQLLIQPLKNSFTRDLPLPQSLTLYETDKSNLPLTQLFADFSVENYQSAYIRTDEEFDYSSGYIFTITEYIQILLSSEGNLDKGLLIMPPGDELGKSVNKVYLGAGNDGTYRVKLKVWYTQRE
jgi:hypothetical protein